MNVSFKKSVIVGSVVNIVFSIIISIVLGFILKNSLNDLSLFELSCITFPAVFICNEMNLLVTFVLLRDAK